MICLKWWTYSVDGVIKKRKNWESTKKWNEECIKDYSTIDWLRWTVHSDSSFCIIGSEKREKMAQAISKNARPHWKKERTAHAVRQKCTTILKKRENRPRCSPKVHDSGCKINSAWHNSKTLYYKLSSNYPSKVYILMATCRYTFIAINCLLVEIFKFSYILAKPTLPLNYCKIDTQQKQKLLDKLSD